MNIQSLQIANLYLSTMAGMEPNLDYSKIPSAAPPPGVIPNFVNPVTNAPMITIVITILLPLTLLFVSMRVYSNLWVSHKFFKSDCRCCHLLLPFAVLMAIRCLRFGYGMLIYMAPPIFDVLIISISRRPRYPSLPSCIFVCFP